LRFTNTKPYVHVQHQLKSVNLDPNNRSDLYDVNEYWSTFDPDWECLRPFVPCLIFSFVVIGTPCFHLIVMVSFCKQANDTGVGPRKQVCVGYWEFGRYNLKLYIGSPLSFFPCPSNLCSFNNISNTGLALFPIPNSSLSCC